MAHSHWKRVETDNVRMVFICPECKQEHTRVICDDDMGFTGAYRPACYICNDVGVTCDFVSMEVKAGKVEEKK